MRSFVASLLVLLSAGCLSIAGLDGDYVAGEPTAGGASTINTGGSTSASTGGATSASTSASTASSTGSGPACTGTHEYTAAVADCIDLTTPNPDACEAVYGPGEMTISNSAFGIGTPVHSYLRFDIGPLVAGSALASITLRLVVASTAYADSSSSGEIWQLAAFVRDDLFLGPPSNVGTTAIAGSVGAVTLGQTVDWALPTNVVSGESVYVELRPLVSDHADYVNLNGTTPPSLIVTCL